MTTSKYPQFPCSTLTVEQFQKVWELAEISAAENAAQGSQTIAQLTQTVVEELQGKPKDHRGAVLQPFIESLPEAAVHDLQAAMWIGRDDFESYRDARAHSADMGATPGYVADKMPLHVYLRTAARLFGVPPRHRLNASAYAPWSKSSIEGWEE